MADWRVESDIADDAELLVTELVTNAVIHARTGIRLEVVQDEDGIQFSVTDHSTRQVQLRLPAADAVTGRGIFLLDQLAPNWEVVPVAGGKMIRFNLSTSNRSSVSR